MTEKYSLEDRPVPTESQGLVVDPDIQDYYDGPEGLPAPHRLSDIHSTSPYPSFQSQDPFRTSFDTTYRSSMTGARDQQGYDYGAGSGYQSPYGRVNQNDDFGRPSLDDAWGVPANASGGSYNAARDRYVARKELAAGAGGAGMMNFSKPSKSRMWWWVGGLMGIIILAGVIAGVVVATRGGGSSSSGKESTGVVKSDPSDPSNFVKDPALHQSFYGMCYTPINTQYPGCGDTQQNVTEDIQILSQLTTRLRLYGSDCDVNNMVLTAIEETKVDMTVWLAVWVDGNQTTYDRQVAAVVDALKKHGADHVGGVTVGNEYLLNGGAVSTLVSLQAEMRTTLAGLGLGKVLPVGTADAGSMITTPLATGSDYVMSNVHAWFAETLVEDAAGWTWEYFNKNAPSTALLAPNNPAVYMAEVGWPTGAETPAEETLGGAVAGVDELNVFLDTFVCQANNNATSETNGYFMFEYSDEPWKVIFGGVEPHWGLFDSSKKLKPGLVIPDCTHP